MDTNKLIEEWGRLTGEVERLTKKWAPEDLAERGEFTADMVAVNHRLAAILGQVLEVRALRLGSASGMDSRGLSGRS